MSSRLMPLFPRLVSDEQGEQGVFQKGKIISSNISLASELANLMHSAVRGGGMGLKLDVQKAYDSLSWKFLFASLVKFGFSDKWISWIQLLLSSSRLSVLVNGGPVGFFPVGKGLRQGDPISPFSFILAEEVFCRGLKLLVRDGKLKSLPGPRGVSIPSHLFFADDIFIFMNASAKFVKNLQDFLEKYQAFSGKNFNLDKSSLFFGKVAPHRKQYISSLIGIKSERLPTKYLGVEIFKGRVRGSHLLPLLDKIKSKLAGWKGNMKVTKKIVVNWDDVCKPKQEGGLGIRRLRDVNFACLAKLTCQIKHEESFRRWVKLNSDSCSLGNPGKAGGGGLLRNDKAEVLYNYKEFLQIGTNFEAEFQAIIAGIEAANRLGVQS
ncbi:uncharacterized protein LOC122092222 [Macadamia integrifolia]|uniref:uncharacterized protein LOC122092222 n=1 Tax=Macadamia integrifolia TaxID=60698 RepID=UPI001C4F89CF|nr:uncharacterized protein LOC122092222 [Macadamia integrifolia]